MNRAVLVGRLTKDPESRYTQSNKAVASFTIAVNRNFKNANGETEADFINGVVWGKPAENLSRYMKKGQQIGVDGRIQTRNYQASDGSRRYATEIVAENIQFLESKQQNDNQSTSYTQSQQNAPQRQEKGLTNDDFANFGANIDISDDDLPFN